MDWSHVMQIRRARELSHPNNTSDEPSPASAGGGINAPNLDQTEQLIFRLRAELIDYIEAHGLVDGLIWDGVLQKVEGSKIVISSDMVDALVERLGFMKRDDVKKFLDVYLPENNYVKDENYIHTDNNFTDEDKSHLDQAVVDIEEIKRHEAECDEETDQRFENIKSTIDGIEADISDQSEAIARLTASSQIVFERVETIETALNETIDTVDRHTVEINKVTASTVVLMGDVDGLKKEITRINEVNAGQDERISAIEEFDATVESDISDLKSWQSDVNGEQVIQNQRIESLANREKVNEENIAALIKSDADINEHLREIDREHKKITATTVRLEGEIKTLSEVVSSNKTELELADHVLSDRIEAEKAERAREDTRIEALIEQESSDRENADSEINDKITSETEERIREDVELNQKISGAIESINQEIEARRESDEALNAKIVTATGMIADLKTQFITSTAELSRDIELVNAAIAQEITDRADEDAAIRRSIAHMTNTGNITIDIPDNVYTLINGKTGGVYGFSALLNVDGIIDGQNKFHIFGHAGNKVGQSAEIYFSRVINGIRGPKQTSNLIVAGGFSSDTSEGAHKVKGTFYSSAEMASYDISASISNFSFVNVQDGIDEIKTEMESYDARMESLEGAVSMLGMGDTQIFHTNVNINELDIDLFSETASTFGNATVVIAGAKNGNMPLGEILVEVRYTATATDDSGRYMDMVGCSVVDVADNEIFPILIIGSNERVSEHVSIDLNIVSTTTINFETASISINTTRYNTLLRQTDGYSCTHVSGTTNREIEDAIQFAPKGKALVLSGVVEFEMVTIGSHNIETHQVQVSGSGVIPKTLKEGDRYNITMTGAFPDTIPSSKLQEYFDVKVIVSVDGVPAEMESNGFGVSTSVMIITNKAFISNHGCRIVNGVVKCPGNIMFANKHMSASKLVSKVDELMATIPGTVVGSKILLYSAWSIGGVDISFDGGYISKGAGFSGHAVDYWARVAAGWSPGTQIETTSYMHEIGLLNARLLANFAINIVVRCVISGRSGVELLFVVETDEPVRNLNIKMGEEFESVSAYAPCISP